MWEKWWTEKPTRRRYYVYLYDETQVMALWYAIFELIFGNGRSKFVSHQVNVKKNERYKM
jgi:fumarate reductase subunit C